MCWCVWLWNILYNKIVIGVAYTHTHTHTERERERERMSYHPSHSKGPTFVTDVYEGGDVGLHERRRHCQMLTVGGDVIR